MDFSGIKLPSNRKFGFFFTAVFALVGGYFFMKGGAVPAFALFGLAAVFLLVTLVKAELLLPLNKLWMRFGFLLGMIVSPIVLGVIFFCIFTPVGLLMRLSGRDELRLKPGKRASHWKDRKTGGAQGGGFKHQF